MHSNIQNGEVMKKKLKVVEQDPQDPQEKSTLIGWVSGGAASAVACHLAQQSGEPMVFVRIDPLGELGDIGRFVSDLSAKLYHEDIETISVKTHGNKAFAECTHPYDVLRIVRAIKFPKGAPCTRVLKREVRERFCIERNLNNHVWGFTIEEKHRADRILSTVPGFHQFPLIDAGITKKDCFKYIEDRGITLPECYKNGLNNANCIICIKGGIGYMNKCRELYPERFAELSALEQELGHSCLREKVDGKSRALFLKDLDPERGRHEPIYVEDCGSTGEVCEVQRSIFQYGDD
jgi:hypothetical protein